MAFLKSSKAIASLVIAWVVVARWASISPAPARPCARSLDLQQLRRQVLLSVGFERDAVRGLDPVLLVERFARHARETLLRLRGKGQFPESLSVQARQREDEAHIRVVMVPRHRLQHAGRGKRFGVA